MNSAVGKGIKKWYPLYTHARAEKKACEALQRKGIDAYLPLQRQIRQWSDRKKWVEEPLIKSYLFVNIFPHEQAAVLMTKGISRFIYFSGKISAMPDRQIQELKMLLSSAYELEITEENLMPGEHVVLKGGPLKGFRGEIIEYCSKKQFLIRLGELNQSIIVNVPVEMIERSGGIK